MADAFIDEATSYEVQRRRKRDDGYTRWIIDIVFSNRKEAIDEMKADPSVTM